MPGAHAVFPKSHCAWGSLFHYMFNYGWWHSTSRQIGNNVVYGAPLVANLRNGFSSNMVVVAEETDSMECKFDCHDWVTVDLHTSPCLVTMLQLKYSNGPTGIATTCRKQQPVLSEGCMLENNTQYRSIGWNYSFSDFRHIDLALIWLSQ